LGPCLPSKAAASNLHEVLADDDLSGEVLPSASGPVIIGDRRIVARDEGKWFGKVGPTADFLNVLVESPSPLPPATYVRI
jgi:hypothetical protein